MLTPEQAQELRKFQDQSVKIQIDHIEDILPDLQELADSFAETNEFAKLAKVREMIRNYEEELDAARQGYDAWMKWLGFPDLGNT